MTTDPNKLARDPVAIKKSIVKEISSREGSALRFDEYMNLALYHPTFGYYASGRAGVGTAEGSDFYTSVSVGKLFGRLLATHLKDAWIGLGGGECTLIDFGGNRGLLLEDIMEAAAEDAPEFAAALDPVLVDPFAPFDQSTADKDFETAVDIFAANTLVKDKPVLLVANELLDALSVRRFEIAGSGWSEHWVEAGDDGELSIIAREGGHPSLPGPASYPDGYMTEVSENSVVTISGLAKLFPRAYFLFLDYGLDADDYFSIARSEGTLRGYRAHQRCDDPLAAPGDTDLTTHVNWTAAVEAATDGGLTAAGFSHQGRFLTAVAEPLLRAMDGSTPDPSFIRQFQQLTHPTAMGAKFQALGLWGKDVALNSRAPTDAAFRFGQSL